MILSDNETKVDLLNNEPIAHTIVQVLRRHAHRPITIGIHGDWGAGKSSVLEMLEAALETESGVLCLKFNGWRFQGFEDAKIALIEGIVTGLIEKRPALTKMATAVADLFKRIDWLKIAKKAGGLAFTVATGIPTPDLINTVVTTLQNVAADPAKFAAGVDVESAIESVQSLLKPAESKRIPEEIAEFRKAFDDLLDKAGIQQLVVLIDDLDRCLPETAIETLEAIRLFVFAARTAFVVAADEAMIEYAVRKHFPDLPDTTGPQTYARNYLEKLIQVPFRIPNLGDAETRIYVALLLISAELGENDPRFNALIAVARKKLQRPWITGGLDSATVRQIATDKASQAQAMLTLGDQISPILASGAKGNPRQIKRFLNALVLRQQIAEARGFGDEIKLAVLAKLMLAERFLPRFFDQIASMAAKSTDGTSPEVAALEAAALSAAAPARPERDAKVQALKPTENPTVTEWLSSPSIKSWAEVTPAIGGYDLRPYLFVAKDRKDYFGATSVLGHLATLAEQLLGNEFTVKGLADDLKRLAEPEAAQLFDLIRGRIIGEGVFDKIPSGIAGMNVLVAAHPTLQAQLLDFLEGLPDDRLGGWACRGWQGVISEPDAATRFRQLLTRWSNSTSGLLKAAAKTALAAPRKGA